MARRRPLDRAAAVAPRLVLVLFLVLAPACGGDGGGAAPGAPAGTRPSVLLFLVDTLRADALGCYGGARGASPTIDALAREGVVFEECQAQSSWTKPATASILTGLLPSAHGANQRFSVLGERHVTLAEVLDGAGYRTGAFGSNLYVFGPRTGFERGFDRFEASPPGDDVPYGRGGDVVDRALAWLAGLDGEPFFLYCHLLDPHHPYDPLPPFRARFERPYDGGLDGFLRRDGVEPSPAELAPADFVHLRDLYDGEVAYADAQLARLVEALERAGRLADTLVVVVSDHGEEFGEHGGWLHGRTLFQEVLRVPLVVRPPARVGLPAGARVASRVRQVDVLPTVLDLVGLAVPEGVAGRSLVPFARGEASPPRPVLSEVDQLLQRGTSVVLGDLKYVRWWTPEEREELYDLAADPEERESLLPARARLADPLRAILERHLETAPGRYTLVLENLGEETLRANVYLASTARTVSVTDFPGCELEEGAPDQDGPFVPGEHELDGERYHVVHLSFTTRPGDRDGAVFLLEDPEALVRVGLDLVETEVPPERVQLADGSHPAAVPFEIDPRASERLLVPSGEPPAPAADGGSYRFRLWKSPAAAAATYRPGDEELEALGALGYLGY